MVGGALEMGAGAAAIGEDAVDAVSPAPQACNAAQILAMTIKLLDLLFIPLLFLESTKGYPRQTNGNVMEFTK